MKQPELKKSIHQRMGFTCWLCDKETKYMYPIEGISTKESAQVFRCSECQRKAKTPKKHYTVQQSLF